MTFGCPGGKNQNWQMRTERHASQLTDEAVVGQSDCLEIEIGKDRVKTPGGEALERVVNRFDDLDGVP